MAQKNKTLNLRRSAPSSPLQVNVNRNRLFGHRRIDMGRHGDGEFVYTDLETLNPRRSAPSSPLLMPNTARGTHRHIAVLKHTTHRAISHGHSFKLAHSSNCIVLVTSGLIWRRGYRQDSSKKKTYV